MKNLMRLAAVGSVGMGLLLAACGSGDKGDKGDPGAPGAAGKDGASGANGKDGTATPTFQIVEPRAGLLAREVDVTLSAEGATFDAASPPAVDFADAKITVSDVKVVSATTVYAHLKIDGAATLGAHDVTVGALKGTGAFEVKPDFTTTLTGTAKQGSFFKAALHNNDHDNFFDPNAVNFAVAGTGTGLFTLSGVANSATDATAIFLVEPSAATAKQGLALTNDSTSTTAVTWLGDPAQIDVQANAPTALTLPYTKAGDALAAPGDSKFFKVTVPASSIVNFTVDVKDAKSPFVPLGVIFPPSGKVADADGLLAPVSGFFGPNPPPYHLIASIPNTTNAAVDHTIVLFDQQGAGGAAYTFDMASTAVTATTAAETATAANAHSKIADAQALTLPAMVTGTIAANDETDLYKLTVTNGQVIEYTIVGDAGVDSQIQAATSDPVVVDTGADFGVTSGKFVDSREFTATAAGTVYLIVSADATLAKQQGGYTLAVRVVTPAQ